LSLPYQTSVRSRGRNIHIFLQSRDDDRHVKFCGLVDWWIGEFYWLNNHRALIDEEEELQGEEGDAKYC